MTELLHEDASSILKAGYHIGVIKGNQPGPNIDRRGLGHHAAFNEGKFGRPAAHVDVEHGFSRAL